MTREEAAIKSCEDRIKHLKSAPTHHYGKRQRERAIELEKVKIKALRPVSREQVERMAGEWVQDINKGPAVFYCSSCGESFEIHSYEFQKYRFCPFCMAPMTDVAEEMVMERLEALKDDQA